MDATRYGLMFTHTDSPGIGTSYRRLQVRAVEIADDGSPRNLWTDDAYRTTPFGGLMIAAQTDTDDRGMGRGYSYGWRYGIAGDCGDMIVPEQLSALAPTLRRIARGLASADAAHGPAESFGAYVARIAAAIGLPVLTGVSGGDGTYSSGRWIEWTSGDAARVINDRIADFRSHVA